jgi:ATP-dependent helicase/nuclease subunit B
LKDYIYTRLVKFTKAVSNAHSGSAILNAIYTLTEDFGVKDNLISLADEFEKAGNRTLQDEYTRIYPLFVDLLDSIYVIYADKKTELRRFADMFSLCASTASVESAPQCTDEVLFAAVGSARAENKKCVYIPRMNQCHIPLVKKQSLLITDADKRVFEKYQIPISLDTQMLYFAAHFDFYLAATTPSHELVLSYSCFTPSGDPLAESEYLTFIKNATGVQDTTRDMLPKDFFLVSLSGAADVACRTGNDALHRAVQSLGGTATHKEEENCALTQQIVDALYSRHLRLSFSGMEEYIYCPFKFFMNRGLKARPLEPVQFNSADIGTFIHKGLENLLSGDYDISTPETVAKAVNIISDEYYNTTLADMKGRSRRFDYMFERAKKTFGDAAQSVSADIRNSDFRPYSFELDISQHGDPYTIDDQHTLTLVGSIDRVDMTDDGYAKIVDYKSGSQAFSLENMYNGLSLQLPVYASAVKAKDENLKIAAMYYLKVGVPDVEDNSQTGITDDEYQLKLSRYYSRDGIFSADENIKDRLDAQNIKDSRIFSQQKIDRLIDFTKDKIVETGRGILSGNTDISPLTDKPCMYCDYKTVCAIAQKDGCTRAISPLPDNFLEEAE